MRTFKQHIKEAHYEGDAQGVGTMNQNSIEDSVIGAFNVENPEVLKKVNAFVESISNGEYITPQIAIDSLREKLQRIGLTVSPVTLTGDSGKVVAEVKLFGGRFGKDTDGSDIDDDGISHKKEGGLKMEVSYETLKTGTSKVYAKLV